GDFGRDQTDLQVRHRAETLLRAARAPSADLRVLPAGRHVAAIAAVHPAERDVRRVAGRQQLTAVAADAGDVGGHEVAGERARVAAVAGHRGVRAGEREARARVRLALVDHLPGGLLVAARAVRSELGEVRVLVAAGAAARGDDLHRAAVVVAAQAQRIGVRPAQLDAGLLAVVEREARPQLLPLRAEVAQAAVGRERVVRQDRTEPGPPAVQLGA